MIIRLPRSSTMVLDAICGLSYSRTLGIRVLVWVSGWKMAQEASIWLTITVMINQDLDGLIGPKLFLLILFIIIKRLYFV